MNRQELIELLKADIKSFNRYRRQCPDQLIDLRCSEFSNVNLKGANLENVNLHWAILEKANLIRTNLRGADLSDSNLEKANLKDADLTGANLRNTNLAHANLTGAKIDYQLEKGLLLRIKNMVLENHSSLDMDEWHSSECKTVHCIAGWAVTLSHSGKHLERKYGTQIAGLLLLGREAHSHFFDNNRDALEWLESIADLPEE